MASGDKPLTWQQGALVGAGLGIVVGLVCVLASFDQRLRDRTRLTCGVSAVALLSAGVTLACVAGRSQWRRSRQDKLGEAAEDNAFTLAPAERVPEVVLLGAALREQFCLGAAPLGADVRAMTLADLSAWLHRRLSAHAALRGAPGAAERVRGVLVATRGGRPARDVGLRDDLNVHVPRGRRAEFWTRLRPMVREPLPRLDVSAVATWVIGPVVAVSVLAGMVLTAQWLDRVAPLKPPDGAAGEDVQLGGKAVGRIVFFVLVFAVMFVVMRVFGRWLRVLPKGRRTLLQIAALVDRNGDAGWTEAQVWAELRALVAAVRRGPVDGVLPNQLIVRLGS